MVKLAETNKEMDLPFDKEQHLEIVKKAKVQIRARMKALRGGYSQASLAARSAKIVDALLVHPAVAQARSVACFWPMEGRGEVDLRLLDEKLRERGVDLYYPFMDRLPDGRTLTGFRLTGAVSELVASGQGFLQPNLSAKAADRGDIDLVIVPALAADAEGHRIGYGAGYYDATLGDVCPPARSLIVAYHFQLMAELPHEAHDKPCDFIVTDEKSFDAARA